MWVILVILCVGVFTVELLARIAIVVTHVDPAIIRRAGARPTGISINVANIVQIVLEVLLLVGSWIVAGLIFLKKSDDWLAIFVSGMLIAFGVAMTGVPANIVNLSPQVIPTIRFVRLLGYWLFIAFLYLFPDGRFYPRWTLLLAILAGVLFALWQFFPRILPIRFERLNLDEQLLFVLFWFVTGLIAQLLRRRHSPNLTEAQQGRWAILGLVVSFVCVTLADLVIIFLFPSLRITTVPGFLLWLVMNILYTLGFLFIPITIGISILRYRLWDIDRVVNQAVIYTLSLGILMLIYLGISTLVQNLVNSIDNQDTNFIFVELKSMIGAIVAFVSFVPIRERLKLALAKRFHHERVDAPAAFADLVRQTRSVDSLPALLPMFGQFVLDTMHIDSGAVFTRDNGTQADEFSLLSGYHLPIPNANQPDALDVHKLLTRKRLDSLRKGQLIGVRHPIFQLIVPLIDTTNDRLLGFLALGPKHSGARYSDEDKVVIAGLAQQISMAFSAERLITGNPPASALLASVILG